MGWLLLLRVVCVVLAVDAGDRGRLLGSWVVSIGRSEGE